MSLRWFTDLSPLMQSAMPLRCTECKKGSCRLNKTKPITAAGRSMTFKVEAFLIQHEGTIVAEQLHRVSACGCGIAIDSSCSVQCSMLALLLSFGISFLTLSIFHDCMM